MDSDTDVSSEVSSSEMEEEETRVVPFTGDAFGTGMDYWDNNFGQLDDNIINENDHDAGLGQVSVCYFVLISTRFSLFH